jgi:hypothetical protein
MSRTRHLLAAAVAAVVPIGLVAATPSVAAASDGTTCVQYTETTGACITQWYGDNGTLHTMISFYWGNHWVDYQLA